VPLIRGKSVNWIFSRISNGSNFVGRVPERRGRSAIRIVNRIPDSGRGGHVPEMRGSETSLRYLKVGTRKVSGMVPLNRSILRTFTSRNEEFQDGSVPESRGHCVIVKLAKFVEIGVAMVPDNRGKLSK
jgi:hypothetical protein